MGNKASGGEKEKEGGGSSCLDTEFIFFDSVGNLVYSTNIRTRDREEEMKLVLEAEVENDKEEKLTAAILEKIEKANEEQARLAKRAVKKSSSFAVGDGDRNDLNVKEIPALLAPAELTTTTTRQRRRRSHSYLVVCG